MCRQVDVLRGIGRIYLLVTLLGVVLAGCSVLYPTPPPATAEPSPTPFVQGPYRVEVSHPAAMQWVYTVTATAPTTIVSIKFAPYGMHDSAAPGCRASFPADSAWSQQERESAAPLLVASEKTGTAVVTFALTCDKYPNVRDGAVALVITDGQGAATWLRTVRGPSIMGF